ncbi:MAG: zf-TFIIB domain-containing protein [Armatimonadia bacterium]
MQCPVCDDKMKEVERSGVLVDICPSCKGIWLDRGELDKLLALSEARQDTAAVERPCEPRPELAERSCDRDGEHDEYRHPRHDERDRLKEAFRGPQKRRGSWLADILEGIGGD